MAKKKEKRFEVDVDVKWTEVAYATTKAKAIQQVKYSFADEYNIDLGDEEIKSVREIK